MKILAYRLAIAVLFSAGAGCGADAAEPSTKSDKPPTTVAPSADASEDIVEPAQSDASSPTTSADVVAEVVPEASDRGSDTGSVPAADGPVESDAGALAGWRLLWSDEFNGPAGTKPDPTKWGYDLGGGGWGVAQLQTYTSDAANAAMDGKGNLAIVALKSQTGEYTSARLKTEGKFEQAYGRFEARAKIPSGVGMWPAFWTLGSDFESAGWPSCGEIDIMENRAIEPAINHGSLHGPGYSGSNPLTAIYTLGAGAAFPDDFHTFAIEWETNVVRFYVDNQLYETRTPMDLTSPTTQTWVYDHAHFMLLNLAVGGRFPTNPDATTTFPQTLLVDYVRVYTR